MSASLTGAGRHPPATHAGRASADPAPHTPPGNAYRTSVRRSDSSQSRRPVAGPADAGEAELARREGSGAEAGLAAQLAAGTALVAFNTVLRSWCDGDGAEDPAALTDRAFAVIAPALDPSGR
ncbi:hypothetical protein ACIQM3_16295 [Streptomyces sp. NPDC091271]|uniref:hypothetical protein n=1 Tax=Streptomyces sp. NPDC091271 TaxID=3365980 RepID=UPI0037FE3BBE